MNYKDNFMIKVLFTLCIITSIAHSSEVIISHSMGDSYLTVNIRNDGSVLYRKGKKLEERVMDWEFMQVDAEKANAVIVRAGNLINNHELNIDDLIIRLNVIHLSLRNGRSSVSVDSENPGAEMAALITMIESLSPSIRISKIDQ
jgi:hypothetical protein